MKKKLTNIDLTALLVLSVVFFFTVEISRREEPEPYFSLKKKASNTTAAAFAMLKEEFKRRGHRIDPVNDPGETGLIGTRISPITTDAGDLSAKITSVNPNFSALFIGMLKDAGLSKSDHVAVAMTGSFPALNVALLVALQTLGLEPVIVTSVGSSSWGANIPGWTYLDMESFLFEKGILTYRTMAASLGGADDLGRGLEEADRIYMKNVIVANHVPIVIQEKYLEKSVEKRMAIYDARIGKKKEKLFVNIGGGIASFGVLSLRPFIKMGLNYPYDFNGGFQSLAVKGTIVRFLERNVPVLNLLDISKLAKANQMPIAPSAIPPAAEGPLFFKDKYPVSLLLIELVTFLLVLYLVLHKGIPKLSKDKSKPQEDSI